MIAISTENARSRTQESAFQIPSRITFARDAGGRSVGDVIGLVSSCIPALLPHYRRSRLHFGCRPLLRLTKQRTQDRQRHRALLESPLVEIRQTVRAAFRLFELLPNLQPAAPP